MYGTIARMRVKSGAEGQIRKLMREYDSLKVPGLVTEYVYQMDSDPREYYLAVVFESKETYLANASSPEQDARYRQLRELLEADPGWHDGEIVVAGKQR